MKNWNELGVDVHTEWRSDLGSFSKFFRAVARIGYSYIVEKQICFRDNGFVDFELVKESYEQRVIESVLRQIEKDIVSGRLSEIYPSKQVREVPTFREKKRDMASDSGSLSGLRPSYLIIDDEYAERSRVDDAILGRNALNAGYDDSRSGLGER